MFEKNIFEENREKHNSRSITTTTTLKTLALSSTVPSVSGFALTFLKVSPVITCQALWAAPYPTIKEVVRKKSTEGLPPLPYYSMMANGFLWVVYGCVCDFNPTIIVPNATGLLCGTYVYQSTFFSRLRHRSTPPTRTRTHRYYTMQYAKNSSGKFNLMPYTIGAASLMGTVGGIGMFMEQAVAQNAIGLIGCGVVVAMLGGPLQVFKEVVRTKSTKDLPLPMAIATVFNSACWFGFGSLVVHDAYVWAPNIIGVASGITQLALIAKYGIHRDDASDGVKEE